MILKYISTMAIAAFAFAFALTMPANAFAETYYVADTLYPVAQITPHIELAGDLAYLGSDPDDRTPYSPQAPSVRVFNVATGAMIGNPLVIGQAGEEIVEIAAFEGQSGSYAYVLSRNSGGNYSMTKITDATLGDTVLLKIVPGGVAYDANHDWAIHSTGASYLMCDRSGCGEAFDPDGTSVGLEGGLDRSTGSIVGDKLYVADVDDTAGITEFDINPTDYTLTGPTTYYDGNGTDYKYRGIYAVGTSSGVVILATLNNTDLPNHLFVLDESKSATVLNVTEHHNRPNWVYEGDAVRQALEYDPDTNLVYLENYDPGATVHDGLLVFDMNQNGNASLIPIKHPLQVEVRGDALYVTQQFSSIVSILHKVEPSANTIVDDLVQRIENANAGDTVTLDAGATYEDAILRIDKPLTLDGNGAVLTGFSAVHIASSNVTVTGLTFENIDAARGSAPPVVRFAPGYTDAIENILVENNRFVNSAGGVGLAAAANTTQNIVVRGNTFENIGTEYALASAIRVGASFYNPNAAADGIVIEGNTVKGATSVAVRVTNADNSFIIGNTISDVPLDAITVARANNTVIAANAIANATYSGDYNHLLTVRTPDNTAADDYYFVSRGLERQDASVAVTKPLWAPINIWADSRGVTISGNTISDSMGGIALCTATCESNIDGLIHHNSFIHDTNAIQEAIIDDSVVTLFGNQLHNIQGAAITNHVSGFKIYADTTIPSGTTDLGLIDGDKVGIIVPATNYGMAGTFYPVEQITQHIELAGDKAYLGSEPDHRTPYSLTPSVRVFNTTSANMLINQSIPVQGGKIVEIAAFNGTDGAYAYVLTRDDSGDNVAQNYNYSLTRINEDNTAGDLVNLVTLAAGSSDGKHDWAIHSSGASYIATRTSSEADLRAFAPDGAEIQSIDPAPIQDPSSVSIVGDTLYYSSIWGGTGIGSYAIDTSTYNLGSHTTFSSDNNYRGITAIETDNGVAMLGVLSTSAVINQLRVMDNNGAETAMLDIPKYRYYADIFNGDLVRKAFEYDPAANIVYVENYDHNAVRPDNLIAFNLTDGIAHKIPIDNPQQVEVRDGLLYVTQRFSNNAVILGLYTPSNETVDVGAMIEGSSAGDTISLDSGTTYVNFGLIVDKPVTINGNGATVTGASSIIIASSNVTITGITFADITAPRGTSPSVIAVAGHAGSLENIVIENNRFVNTPGGVDVGTASHVLKSIVIRGNTFENIGTPYELSGAIAVSASRYNPLASTSDITIQDNTITGTTGGGIGASNVDDVTIAGNTIRDVPLTAIAASSSTNVVIDDNTITNAVSTGDYDHVMRVRNDSSADDSYYFATAQGVNATKPNRAPINVWADSENVTLTRNSISDSNGGISFCAGTCTSNLDGLVHHDYYVSAAESVIGNSNVSTVDVIGNKFAGIAGAPITNHANFTLSVLNNAFGPGADKTLINSTNIAVSASAPTGLRISAPSTVNEGDSVRITGSASNPDGLLPLEYQWSADAGTFSDSTSASTIFNAPANVNGDTGVTLTLRVSIDDQSSLTRAIITVLDSAVAAPADDFDDFEPLRSSSSAADETRVQYTAEDIGLYSVSWDCEAGTMSIVLSDSSRPGISVRTTQAVPVTQSAEQDLPGRTIYNAPYAESDRLIFVTINTIIGGEEAVLSESIRTGGSCTGERAYVSFAQPAPTPIEPTPVTPEPDEPAAPEPMPDMPSDAPTTEPEPDPTDDPTAEPEPTVPSDEPDVAPEPEESGCLIATAAYGSELAPQVQLLREVRDGTLFSTTSGTTFMTTFNDAYYAFSPAIADMERENPLFRDAVRALIAPMLSTLSIMTLADEGSESQVLGLGILVIALNIALYIAAPIAGITLLARRIKSVPLRSQS